MTEVDKCWQNLDRAMGYIQGFIPSIWAMSTMDEREVVTAESICEFEQVVSGMAVDLARVREIGEKE